jgi:SPP1 family predicted phage head-tail adaptor
MSVFDGLMNETYTVSRTSRLPDGQGGWTKAWVEIGSVPGRMRPANSAERQVALQEEREITHVLYVRATADIARGDQVEGGGIAVEVQGVRNPSQAGHHLEIDCRETQLEATVGLYP